MKYNKLSDSELVELFRRGEFAAFEEVYARYLKVVYRYAYSRTDSRETAEDITSEVFMTLLKVAGNFTGQGKFSTFVIGIAVNKLRQHWDKLAKQSSIPLPEWLELAEPEVQEEGDLHKELLQVLPQILASLPVQQSQVLEMRYQQGVPLAEIAAKLNISNVNLRVIQHRALKAASKLATNYMKHKHVKD